MKSEKTFLILDSVGPHGSEAAAPHLPNTKSWYN